MAPKSKLLIAACIALAALLVFGGFGCPKKPADKKQKQIEELQAELEKTKEDIKKLRAGQAEQQEEEQAEAPVEQKATITTKQFGYIKKVYESGSKTYLVVDYAQMLTGAAADSAAVAAGEIAAGEHVPNDYFIKNTNPKLRTFRISPSVKIIAQTYSMGTAGKVGDQIITLSKFKYIFKNKPSSYDNMVVNPWWLWVKGSTVTKLKEQYLP